MPLHQAVVLILVDGDPPIWVDPTDEFARAGELPLMDQGRLTLVAKPGTTALLTTPVAESVANRTVEKALALERRFAPFGPVEGGDYARLSRRQFELIVNATSASLSGELPPLPPGVFASGSLAYDMVYGDEATRFLIHAREHGAAQLADGWGMLLAQAAESFFLWRGVRPDTRPLIGMLRGR